MEDVWTMRKSYSMVFCKLAFVSNHESFFFLSSILVHAVKAYVWCRGVAPLILDLGTRCW
jgi:hypothetical protein